MKDISNIDAVIEDLKSYNANDHTKLAPSNVTEYSRQAALNVLLSSWEHSLREGNITLRDLFYNIDVTVDKLEEFKPLLCLDIEKMRALNSNGEVATVTLVDDARKAAINVLIDNWEKLIKDKAIYHEQTADTVFKAEMERDLLYVRAELLKFRAIMEADYKDVLDEVIEPRQSPRFN